MAQGEMGYETDTGKLKFGNGVNAWTGLSYFPSAGLTTSTVFAGDTEGFYNTLVTYQASQDFAFTSDVTITTTGTLDNYAFSDTATVLRWNGASDLTFSGMATGTDGRLAILLNVTSAKTLTLSHDSTSTAGNRFYCPSSASYAIANNSGCIVIYDATSSRWRVIDVAAAAAGGSATYAGVWKFPGI